MVNTETSDTSTESILGEARINPKTGKPATALQGSVLLAVSALPILGAVLIAPNLANMTEAFADVPGVAGLVPLALVIPAVFIALIAPVAGLITDKVGRKRVTLIALVAYAIVGTAPLWIPTLPGIIVSRALVGVVEAFLITGCTALIADYFSGGRRNKYLGLQAVVASLSATLFLLVGGVLGGIGWRVPFALYAVSIPIAVIVAFVIWPTNQKADGSEASIAKLQRLPIRPLVIPVVFTLLGGIVFYVFIVQLSFILKVYGVTDPALVGLFAALTSLASAVAAMLFRRIAKWGTRVVLTLEFAVAALGFFVVAFAPSVPFVVIGAIISSFATGALLPTLIVWSIARLPYDQRGRGTGAFASSLFIGQFLSPVVVIAATAATGGLNGAIGAIGVGSVVVAAIVALVVRSPSRDELPASPVAAVPAP